MSEPVGRIARIAGGVYLAVAIAGSVGLYLRAGLVVRNDAAATAANIVGAEGMYRASVVADLVGALGYVVVAALLYVLLRVVDRNTSVVAAFVGLAGSVVSAATLVAALAPLVLLGQASYLAAFGQEQLDSLAMIFMRVQALGSNLGFVFFGCYCVLLGLLVWRATFMPRVLGVGLALAGTAWLINSVASLLGLPFAAALSPYALAVGALGEMAFTLWLLVRGVNDTAWHEQAATVAHVHQRQPVSWVERVHAPTA